MDLFEKMELLLSVFHPRIFKLLALIQGAKSMLHLASGQNKRPVNYYPLALAKIEAGHPFQRVESIKMNMRSLTTLCITFLFAVSYAWVADADDSPLEKRIQSGRKNVEEKVERLLNQLTLEEKVSLCHANSKFAIAGVERLGIAEMWMSDGPHGVREEISRDSWAPAGWDDDYATYLPPLTAVAASFNPEMARLHGSVLGAEARHRKKDVILGPGVNLARNPLYGRNFEYFGEDPFLAAKLVVPEIIAIQNNDVAACIKHYAVNNQELNRQGVNAMPDERTLREIYLPAFEAAVKDAGVLTMMGSYNEFRGTNCNQSEHLVRGILKGEWGYQGLLMTDWDCDINTRDAALNGLDIEMGTRKPTYEEYYLAQPFLELLKTGEIPLEILDDKVRRILRVQLTIGMMDENRKPGSRETEEHFNNARRIIEEGIVLLKNSENHLPLNQNDLKRVLVLGPNADVPHGHGGGSSQVKSKFEITPLAGLRKKIGDSVEVVFMKAKPPESEGLQPISPDFVITKESGTGTPAWKNLIYPDASQTKNSGFRWATTSVLRFDDDEVHHERLIAELQPIKSGTHEFMIEATGDFDLAVDGQTILKKSDAKTGQIASAEIDLVEGKTYSVRVIYNGKGGLTLGWNAPGDLFVEEEVYLAAAKEADAVLYFGGLNHGFDRESEDRPDMKLPASQDAIISNLIEANEKTIVVLIAGSAVEMPWVDEVNSLIWGWYGGMFAGDAYADVLFGDIVPSGKMPITLPRKLADNPHVILDDYNAESCLYKEDVFMGYRWFEKENIEPMFPFGHGLSYATFEYSDLKLSQDTIGPEDTLTATTTIKNTGDVPAAEVVQLYVTDLESSLARPAKELKGFSKVLLNPGESKRVSILLTRKELSFWDIESNNWKAEPGDFEVGVGASVGDIRQKAGFRLK